MGSLPGLSWTFARCLIARPIRPTTTSTAPASISQCGNSNHPIAVLTVSNLLPRLQPELDQAADVDPLGAVFALSFRKRAEAGDRSHAIDRQINSMKVQRPHQNLIASSYHHAGFIKRAAILSMHRWLH
jgi:hypothetical protein